MAEQPSRPLNGTPSAYLIDTLMQTHFEALRWLVAGMIPEGTVLIAGRPKSGKSWFVLNLLIAAAMGTEFLDRKVIRCGALYLALEESERRLQSRLQLLLSAIETSDYQFLHQLEYRCDWPVGDAGAALLDEYLTSRPHMKLVAVDVLKNIRIRDSGRRNMYDVDYEALEAWRRVTNKHRVTLLIVHHTNKKDAADVFDEINGSHGLSGGVDQMIILRKLPTERIAATLHLRGRDLPHGDDAFGVELVDGWWHVVGTAAEVAMNDVRKQVMATLWQHQGGMKAVDIMRSIGRNSLPSVTRLLHRMSDDGLIKHEDKMFKVCVVSEAIIASTAS